MSVPKPKTEKPKPKPKPKTEKQKPKAKQKTEKPKAKPMRATSIKGGTEIPQDSHKDSILNAVAAFNDIIPILQNILLNYADIAVPDPHIVNSAANRHADYHIYSSNLYTALRIALSDPRFNRNNIIKYRKLTTGLFDIIVARKQSASARMMSLFTRRANDDYKILRSNDNSAIFYNDLSVFGPNKAFDNLGALLAFIRRSIREQELPMQQFELPPPQSHALPPSGRHNVGGNRVIKRKKIKKVMS